jgi:hypothetical protein
MKSEILDRDYNLVDEYSETWTVRDERAEGKVAQFLFPAQIKMTDKKSGFIKFFFEPNKSFNWLILSLLFVVVHFIILKRKKEKLGKHIIDFCIIALTGVFGFISVTIFPNKFFD